MKEKAKKHCFWFLKCVRVCLCVFLEIFSCLEIFHHWCCSFRNLAKWEMEQWNRWNWTFVRGRQKLVHELIGDPHIWWWHFRQKSNFVRSSYICTGWGFERRPPTKGDRHLGVTSCRARLQDEQGNILLKMLGISSADGAFGLITNPSKREKPQFATLASHTFLDSLWPGSWKRDWHVHRPNRKLKVWNGHLVNLAVRMSRHKISGEKGRHIVKQKIGTHCTWDGRDR